MCLLRTFGNSPLCCTGHPPFGATALLSGHFYSWSLQAGHWVPLTMCDPWTTYCPWATCYDFIYLTSLLLPKWSGDLKYGPCPTWQNNLLYGWSIGLSIAQLTCVKQSALPITIWFYSKGAWRLLLPPRWENPPQAVLLPPLTKRVETDTEEVRVALQKGSKFFCKLFRFGAIWSRNQSMLIHFSENEDLINWQIEK